MPRVEGFLHIKGSDGRPDNSLPGAEGPVDPGYGIDAGLGIWHDLPRPPPGVWPPPVPAHPIVPLPVYPDQGLPDGGEYPDQGLPPSGEHPDQGLPSGGEHPDQGLPLPPGTVWPPTPGAKGKFVVLAGIPGYGWRYIVVDLSLRLGHLPGMTPEPK